MGRIGADLEKLSGKYRQFQSPEAAWVPCENAGTLRRPGSLNAGGTGEVFDERTKAGIYRERFYLRLRRLALWRGI